MTTQQTQLIQDSFQQTLAYGYKEELARKYQQGRTQQSLADEYGMSRWSISKALKEVLGPVGYKRIQYENTHPSEANLTLLQSNPESVLLLGDELSVWDFPYIRSSQDEQFDLEYLKNRPIVMNVFHPMFVIHCCCLIGECREIR